MNADIFSLENKTALITGGAGYLGEAIAKGLAAYGARVIIWARNEEKMQHLVDEICAAGGKAEYRKVDLFSQDDLARAIQEFPYEKLNILINNAYTGGGGTTEVSTESDFQNAYQISVVSAYQILKGLLPRMRNAVQSSGVGASVINIGSMYGMVSPDISVYDTPQGTNPPFYGAAKAALLQLTKYWACEFGREGIRVNGLSFGPFPNTTVQKNMPEFCDKLAKKVPLGRIGQAKEAVGGAVFLASDAASFVNGTNVVVDGGWNAW